MRRPAMRNVHRLYSDRTLAIRGGGPVEPNFATGAEVHQLLGIIEPGGPGSANGSDWPEYRCGNREVAH